MDVTEAAGRRSAAARSSRTRPRPSTAWRSTHWTRARSRGCVMLKGREAGKAISVSSSGPAMLESLCAEIPPLAQRLMAAHWPGALTLALPARPGLSSALVTDGCVAVRQSSHPMAAALVSAWGGAITATSANRAGAPPATSAQEVRAAFPAEVDDGSLFVLDGGETAGGLPSTVVRLRDGQLQVLRQGAVAL